MCLKLLVNLPECVYLLCVECYRHQVYQHQPIYLPIIEVIGIQVPTYVTLCRQQSFVFFLGKSFFNEFSIFHQLASLLCWFIVINSFNNQVSTKYIIFDKIVIFLVRSIVLSISFPNSVYAMPPLFNSSVRSLHLISQVLLITLCNSDAPI